MSNDTQEDHPPEWYCGAKKTDGSGDTCRRPAGDRTSHQGRGRCYLHGGNTPGQVIKAEREEVYERARTYGASINIAPEQALKEEVCRTAGHVRWLSEVVANILHEGDGYEIFQDEEGKQMFRPKTGLKQMDNSGKFEKASVWVEMYQKERDMLVRVCKVALDAGIAQREIQLAEAQGEMMGRIVIAVIGDPELGLTMELQEIARRVFGRHMRAFSAAS